jgi:hypothetical protein
MSVHRVQCLAQITRCSVKKMFAGARTPEGVSIKAAAGLRTQLHVPPKAIFLKNPSLHIAPRLLGYLVGLSRTCNPSNEVFLWSSDFLLSESGIPAGENSPAKPGICPTLRGSALSVLAQKRGLDFGFAEG